MSTFSLATIISTFAAVLVHSVYGTLNKEQLMQRGPDDHGPASGQPVRLNVQNSSGLDAIHRDALPASKSTSAALQ